MSEFSYSYHLRTTEQNAAVELLRRAGVDSVVFAPENGWVSFVAASDPFVSEPKVTSAAEEPLVFICMPRTSAGVSSYLKTALRLVR